MFFCLQNELSGCLGTVRSVSFKYSFEAVSPCRTHSHFLLYVSDFLYFSDRPEKVKLEC